MKSGAGFSGTCAHAQAHRRRERQDAEGLSLRAQRAGRPRFRSGVQARTDAAADAAARRVLRQVHDRRAQGVSEELVRRRQAAPRVATARSTISASMPASRCRSGATRDGSTRTTRAAGSNGIAATTWAAGCGRRPPADQAMEGDAPARSRRSSGIASRAICFAGRDSDRRCCIGHMTAGRFS